ncbi:MAG: PEPxxWA-CTERM sorting domain-containing protein [Pseudomonadota bacterium]
MRLSSLMCGVALAGIALAGSADAAIITIKVSGTYIAGSEATLASNGPVSGEIFVNSTPLYTYGGYTVFGVLETSYIRFGTDDNNYVFSPVEDESGTILAQSTSTNFLSFWDYRDRFTFQFDPLTSDPTTMYEFDSTSVTTELTPSSYYMDLTYALGGRTPPPQDHRRPSFNLTFTTLAAPGAVPEPASWALMIGGFGLAGAALRRRSAAAAA